MARLSNYSGDYTQAGTILDRQQHTAAGGETTYTLTFIDGAEEVYVNGFRQSKGPSAQYTTNGNQIIFAAPLVANDVVILIGRSGTNDTPFSRANGETVVLTNGQRVVTFNTIGTEAIELYVTGPLVDKGRLISPTDYTVTTTSSITLTESYPAGTVLEGIQGNRLAWVNPNDLLVNDGSSTKSLSARFADIVESNEYFTLSTGHRTQELLAGITLQRWALNTATGVIEANAGGRFPVLVLNGVYWDPSDNGVALNFMVSSWTITNDALLISTFDTTNGAPFTITYNPRVINTSTIGSHPLVLASTGSSASGTRASTISSNNAASTGEGSATIASTGISASNVSSASALSSVVLGSHDSDISGVRASAISSLGAAITAEHSVSIGSINANITALTSSALSSSGSTISGARSSAIASDSPTIGAVRGAVIASNLGIINNAATESAVIASGSSSTSGIRSAVMAAFGSQANGGNSVVLGADTCTATAALSSVIASSLSNATGIRSFIASSNTSNSSGPLSSVISSSNCDSEGNNSLAASSSGTTVQGSFNTTLATLNGNSYGNYGFVAGSNQCDIGTPSTNGATPQFQSILGSVATGTTAGYSTTLSSRAVLNNTGHSVVLGYNPVASVPDVSNQTIRLEAGGGIGRFSGGTTTTGFDYAEYFENAEPGIQPAGTIMTQRDGKTLPAEEGDFILGTVTKTAGVIGNAQDFSWHGRYLIDEWGEQITHIVKMVDDRIATEDEISDGYIEVISYESREVDVEETEEIVVEDFEVITRHDVYDVVAPTENPDYVGGDYTPRGDRPEEYSIVGLMGQVFTRVYEDITSEYVSADGLNSFEETRLKAMIMTTPFDANKGYGVCKCLLR